MQKRLVSALLPAAALLAGFCLLGQTAATKSPVKAVPVYGYQIVHVYPHDRGAFTEGLEYHDGFLYESTGLNRRSSLRKVRLETGEFLFQLEPYRLVSLDDGEGRLRSGCDRHQRTTPGFDFLHHFQSAAVA